MPRPENAYVKAVLQLHQNSNLSLKEAWVKMGKPTGWANMRKYARQQSSDEAQEQPKGRKRGRKRSGAASETPSSSSAAQSVQPQRRKRSRAPQASATSSSQRDGSASEEEARSSSGYDAEPDERPKKRRAVRRTSHQVDQAIDRKAQRWMAYKEAHKKASEKYAKALKEGKAGKAGFSSSQIAEEFNKLLSPTSKRRLTSAGIRQWVSLGRAGKSPQKPGPALSTTKRSLLDATGTYAKIMQADGDSQKPRELLSTMAAAVQGTPAAALLSSRQKKARMLRHLRSSECSESKLETQRAENVDDRRAAWLTEENLSRWFDGWEAALKKYGFLERRDDGVLWVPPAKRARIVNCDETHQIMSTVTEAGGSRASVYVDKHLGAGGRRVVKNARHISGLYWTNANREVGPGHFLFDTDAKTPDKKRLDARWTLGLPRVRGYFGMCQPGAEPRVFDATYDVTPKGGMTAGGFTRFIEDNVKPCYPNHALNWEYDEDGNVVKGPVIIKTDSGPDRVVVDEDAVLEREQLYNDGFLELPGLPNGTSANQEMDQLYGEYKQKCNDEAERIVAERKLKAARARRAKQPKVTVSLTNADLGRIVAGKPDAPPDQRPFAFCFGPQKVGEAWNVVGACSTDGLVTRAGLKHPKVRRAESSVVAAAAAAPAAPPAAEAASKYDAIVAVHKASLAALAGQGLNTEVFELAEDAVQKRKVRKAAGVEKDRELADVAPATAEEKRLQALIDGGVTTGSIWINANGEPLNGPLITKAALTRVENAKAAAEATAQKKADQFATLRAQAQGIFEDLTAGGLHLSDTRITGADLRILTRYVFAATSTPGVTKVKTRSDDVNLLVAVGMENLEELLANPPRDTGVACPGLPSLTNLGPLLLTCVDDGASGASAPSAAAGALTVVASFADKFGDVGADLEGYEPVEKPEWLRASLDFGNEAGDKLVGRRIAFHWEGFGWAVGLIGSRNDDEEYGMHRTRGGEWCTVNFTEVHYEVDDADEDHALHLDDYATSAQDPPGSWVLLSEAPKEQRYLPSRFRGRGGGGAGRGRGRGRGRGSARRGGASSSVPDVSALSAEDRKALLAALMADAGRSEDDA